MIAPSLSPSGGGQDVSHGRYLTICEAEVWGSMAGTPVWPEPAASLNGQPGYGLGPHPYLAAPPPLPPAIVPPPPGQVPCVCNHAHGARRSRRVCH